MSKTSGSTNRDAGRANVQPNIDLQIIEIVDDGDVWWEDRRAGEETGDEDAQLWRLEAWHDQPRVQNDRGQIVEFLLLVPALHPPEPGLVRSVNQQWTGPAAFQPPFTVDAFEMAQRNSTLIGRGVHGAREALIGESHYMIKKIKDGDTVGAQGTSLHGEHIVAVTDPERYESTVEMVASSIAQELGVGDSVAHAYAFEHKGEHYVVSHFLDGVRPLSEVVQLDYEFWPKDTSMLSNTQLQRLLVYEYVLSDSDRNAGNYLTHPQTGHIDLVDLSRGLRYEGDHMFGTTLLDVYIAKSQGSANAVLPQHILRQAAEHEQAVVQILQDARLHEGIPGVQSRFARLRGLANAPGTYTVADLGIVDSWRGRIDRWERNQHAANALRGLSSFE